MSPLSHCEKEGRKREILYATSFSLLLWRAKKETQKNNWSFWSLSKMGIGKGKVPQGIKQFAGTAGSEKIKILLFASSFGIIGWVLGKLTHCFMSVICVSYPTLPSKVSFDGLCNASPTFTSLLIASPIPRYHQKINSWVSWPSSSIMSSPPPFAYPFLPEYPGLQRVYCLFCRVGCEK